MATRVKLSKKRTRLLLPGLCSYGQVHTWMAVSLSLSHVNSTTLPRHIPIPHSSNMLLFFPLLYFILLLTVQRCRQLLVEPDLKTNRPKRKLLKSETPDERLYKPEGVKLGKGDEVAVFYMGSTVVLVFQAPVASVLRSADDGPAHSSQFKFCIENGDRIKVGEVIGRWADK